MIEIGPHVTHVLDGVIVLCMVIAVLLFFYKLLNKEW